MRFILSMKIFYIKQKLFFTVLFIVILYSNTVLSQTGSYVGQSQLFRLGSGITRIAETGQLADTVNIWGDVFSPGRYLVPRGTTIHELISYANGPMRYTSGETVLDWSELRLEIGISRYDALENDQIFNHYTFSYNEGLPKELFEYALKNEDVLSMQVKRNPAFVDYLRVIAPVLTAISTTVLVYVRLKD
ncbi:hypothetical protein Ctha_2131 [Chloroherpeton thalassium ATCC 35110]|uniref:Soluble ligand binding domain-containing protein n=1 Tax=Chloroherpeton thalassium (strain ATCC 35110 / GB-78) TaxID=517418 RepID=B3QVI3_CHLT3|nr:hypothetical protein [Chloroherpeton thalassium]ACF14583.1 hypothetical protein Ctha_2131 [Chloroherpeton thalassium ATCC 35110]